MKLLYQHRIPSLLPQWRCIGILLLGSLGLGQGQTITRIPTLGGSSLTASALSDRGQVVGFSFLEGDLQQHAFLCGGAGTLDLGTSFEARSQANAINALGDVVGDASMFQGREVHAWLYRAGTFLDLGTLGGTFSTAMAVNDAGQVAGYSYLAGDLQTRAFLYTEGHLRSLDTLGGSSSSAVDVNRAGQVAGDSWTLNDAELHPFLFDGGQLIDCGTLGGFMASAVDLNDAGMIVGESFTDRYETHAFLWGAGTMVDLGTLGGAFSTATAINEPGHVVGYSYITGNAASHAFLHSGGMLQDLGTLGGLSSYAYDVNDQLQIVGDAADATGKMKAFLWQDGAMVNLNSLLPPNSGWDLWSAFFINNASQVVGYGFFQGQFAWYLLTLPAPNRPPVAQAGPDQTHSCLGQVVLDGTASSDPDGDSLAFVWRHNGAVIGQTALLPVNLPPGSHTFELTVTDSSQASDQDLVVVTIADLIPPTVTCPVSHSVAAGPDGQAPVPDLRTHAIALDNCQEADALVRFQDPAPGTMLPPGDYDLTVTVSDAAGNAGSCVTLLHVVDRTPPLILGCPESVSLTAGPDGTAPVPDLLRTVRATDNCTAPEAIVLVQSPVAATPVPAGTHAVTVTAEDAAGNRASCTITLVVSQPCQLSLLSVSADPEALHPPNHQMQPVTLLVQAESSCGSEVLCQIISVASSEPDTSQGDDTTPDWEITGPLSLNLRAEQSPHGDGRFYTIQILCRDSAGNEAVHSIVVPVLKNLKTEKNVASLNRSSRTTPNVAGNSLK